MSEYASIFADYNEWSHTHSPHSLLSTIRCSPAKKHYSE